MDNAIHALMVEADVSQSLLLPQLQGLALGFLFSVQKMFDV
jgi:hypothetical protein